MGLSQRFAGRLRVVVGLALIGVLCGLIIPAQAGRQLVTGATWRIQSPDAPKWFSDIGPRSLALDAAGRGHVIYGGDHLYYAWFDGVSWEHQVVDPGSGVGQYAALALDATGQSHIAYYDAEKQQVKYTTRSGGAWPTEIVDAAARLSGPLALALDSQGTPHIGYHSESGGVRYARRDATGWVGEAVAADGSGGVALAIDAAGAVTLAYGVGALRVAQGHAGAWDVQVVDSAGATGSPVLALDRAGRPHVAYAALDSTARLALRYARWTRAGWNLQTIDELANRDIGYEPSLVLAADDAPHVSYGAYNGLKYAHWTGSDWYRERVDASGGRFTSLALDDRGKPTISYLSGRELKVARRPGIDWLLRTVDTLRTTGVYTSLALAGEDVAHISYRDMDDGVLRYATGTGDDWTIERVDSLPGVPAPTALALDGEGAPHIAYFFYPDEWTTGALRLARRTGGAWALQTVDGDIGSLDAGGIKQPALKFDGAGRPHISYASGRDRAIKLAGWTGNAWQIETVAGPGQFGQDTALAFDAEDRPQVVYQDAGANALIHARRTAAGWEMATVDTGLAVGGDHALVLDQFGQPHLCYSAYTGETFDLRYARQTAGQWQVQIVAVGAPFTGQDCALALDAANRPVISYYDADQRDLRLARWVEEAWVFETVDSAGDVGRQTSLALDAAGAPHISYHDATDRDLGYAFGRQETPTSTATPTEMPSATWTPTDTPIATETPTPATVTPTATETPRPEWRLYLPLALVAPAAP